MDTEYTMSLRILFPKLSGQIYAKVMDGYWSDIGTLISYYDTNRHVAETILSAVGS